MSQWNTRTDRLTRIVTPITRILEVAYHIGAGCMAVCLVLFWVDRGLIPGALIKAVPAPGESISVHGFSIVFGSPDGSIHSGAFTIFLLAGAMTLELMAWVFRNVHLVLRTTQGQTKFSVGKTPFQTANVRLLRQAGIFLVAITGVQFAFSSLAVLVLGPEMSETSLGLEGLVIGVLVLCLSQWVDMGVRLQEDVDGLV